MKRLPLLAIIMGIVSLFPVIVCSVGVIFFPADRPVPGPMMALVEYSALLLAFTGAVHWGLALEAPAILSAPGTARTDNRRLLLGGLPVLIGWLAIHLTFLGHTAAALAVLLAAFGGIFLMERAAWRRGELPSGYLALRLCITVVVLTCLLAVFLARLI
ncbi:DUF3429 domain-containing protein [Gluconacetobacter tumulisoli]|uniref:DUF3429 domain-containing protein n=1 Tax=Gluconacetobacter tumulisoli TaxID=1286189 RepID=A0A7W4K793_9PROT|nr:DUF3429 domain-containing protein [Gluconacetobacter tumulisoli]MBB2201689.1 DUF3429 domain-containing protein [Gluconacetobacter tumulisoli]